MSVPLPMTFMSIAMDCPLNQAHKHERIGRDHLINQRWDEAERSFLLAAKLMKMALADVSKKKVIEPLQLQVRKLEDMKDVIEIKKKECSSSYQSSKDQNQYGYCEKPASEKVARNEPTLRPPMPRKKSGDQEKEKIKEMNRWQLVPNDIQQLIEEREHDSLLQFLNLNIESSEYRIDPINSSSSFKKIPKSKDVIIEEYKEQNNLLRNAAMGFWKELDKVERENISLKKTIQELQSEVWSLSDRLQNVVGDDNSPESSNHEDTEQFIQKPQLGLLADDMSTDPMIASIIVQPESFFEFENKDKDLTTELEQAAGEEFPEDLHSKQYEHSRLATQHTQLRRPREVEQKREKPECDFRSAKDFLANSIKYEELDEECNTEVAENTANFVSELSSASAINLHQMQFDTAGLPPLSPVHFELSEGDEVLDTHQGDLNVQLS